jgi:hypothetical protein
MQKAAIVEILESPTVKELFLLDAAKWDSILVGCAWQATAMMPPAHARQLVVSSNTLWGWCQFSRGSEAGG